MKCGNWNDNEQSAQIGKLAVAGLLKNLETRPRNILLLGNKYWKYVANNIEMWWFIDTPGVYDYQHCFTSDDWKIYYDVIRLLLWAQWYLCTNKESSTICYNL